MDVRVEILKDIPKEQIKRYEDKVVYNAAVLTREYTKDMRAYPHLSGELEEQELKLKPSKEGHAIYSLLDGTTYAKYVYDMTGVHWTRKSTIPQWYENVYRKKENTIISSAQSKALREIK